MTGTEIALRAQSGAEVDSWAGAMPDIVKLADHIANTEFVPAGLRGKPAAVAAAVLAGREQGIGPMTSLTHMHVVEGRPTMSAELKRARVLADGHELHFEEMTTTRCVVRGRRKGSENWTTVAWSIDDAKRANLVGKNNWKNHPRRMLQARATSELCDLLFPDVVGGLPTTEEIVDAAGDYTDATDGAAAPADKPKRRTAQRRNARPAATQQPASSPAPADRTPAPGPPLPGEDGYDSATQDAPQTADSITNAQLTKLHTVFSAIGWDDRDDRIRAASTIVARPLGSSTELTKEEGRTLIDTLERIAAGPDPSVRLGELIAAAGGDEVVDAEVVEDLPEGYEDPDGGA
jgi:hypothetical protein